MHGYIMFFCYRLTDRSTDLVSFFRLSILTLNLLYKNDAFFAFDRRRAAERA